MGAYVEVEVDVEPVAKILRRMEARGQNLSATMAAVAELLVAEVDDRWRSGGDGEWEPLAESTIRQRRGTEAQILIDTARAVGSVQGDSGPDWAEATTDVSYMVYHASDEPRTVIPYRNPFDLSEAALGRAEERVLADLAEG